MAERPEDLNLPITVVQRLIKEALPDSVIVSKEARHTISRASSVFVLYLTACAVAHADKAKRKTLAVNDILSACGDMEFDSFVPMLNDALKHRKEFLTQNAKAKPAKSAKKTEEVENDAEEVEIEEPEAADAEEEGESEVAHNESKSNDIENSTDEIRKKKRKLTDSEQVDEETKNEEDNDEIEVDDGSSDDEEEEQL